MRSEQPTRVRHVVVLLTTLVAVMLYLDRICLSFAERYIKEDLRLGDEQIAWLFSAFFWAYAAGQVPAGWLTDRYGARITLALYLACWSAFTGWMGLAASLVGLLLLRLGCGLAEAGAYPAAASLLSVWVPPARRGLASGIVSIGGRLGGAAAPVLTAYLMVTFTADAPSLLQPGDLLDPTGLCRQLSGGTGTPAGRLGRQIRLDLPPEAKALVERIASGGGPLGTAEIQVLASGLNQVLSRRDWFDRARPDGFDLPGEANELAAIPATDLSERQVERRNRLLLETAFPDAIRKVYGTGWRPVMLCYGIAGVLIACVFWWFFRNRPRLHPGCNPAEVALIEDGMPVSASQAEARVVLPWVSLLRSPSLWLMSLVAFCTNVGWVFLLTWLPRFLEETYRVPPEQRGIMAGVPLLCGIVGMYAGGWLTDRLKQTRGAWVGRSLLLALSRFVVMGAFVACLYAPTAWAVTAAFAVVAWATDLGTPALWAYSQDVGRRHVGSVLGWSNMWGNLGGAVSPLILGWVKASYQRWDEVFLTCAAVFLVAGVCALAVDAVTPVVPAQE